MISLILAYFGIFWHVLAYYGLLWPTGTVGIQRMIDTVFEKWENKIKNGNPSMFGSYPSYLEISWPKTATGTSFVPCVRP